MPVRRGRPAAFLWVVLVGVIAGTSGGSPRACAQKPRSLAVTVDPRIELMSIIFRLAGNPEYNQGKVEPYTKAVADHFRPYRDHPVVALARRLRRERGVSYDAVMGLAVHLVDAGTLRERVPFEPRPEGLDERWSVTDARNFLDVARSFVTESRFAEFLERHEALYETTVARLEKVLAEQAHLDWFDRFFGTRPSARFTLAVGLLNGGACYGARVLRGPGEEELYCVLGVWMTDAAGNPRFDESVVGTVVHEFSHSYVNPLVYAHEKQLERAGAAMYPWVEAEMARQAYGNWVTMMHESVVRACVVRYVHACEGPEAASREIEEQVERNFLWTAELSQLLGEYEGDRKRYPTFDAVFPKVIEFFDHYAPGFHERMKKEELRRPKVVSMSPTNGATEVNPETTSFTVTFDRAMQDGGWSLVGGGPSFPELQGKPIYDPTRTTLTVRVKLQPRSRYQFQLNSARYQSFRSEGGVALKPVTVTFATGDPPEEKR